MRKQYRDVSCALSFSYVSYFLDYFLLPLVVGMFPSVDGMRIAHPTHNALKASAKRAGTSPGEKKLFSKTLLHQGSLSVRMVIPVSAIAELLEQRVLVNVPKEFRNAKKASGANVTEKSLQKPLKSVTIRKTTIVTV